MDSLYVAAVIFFVITFAYWYVQLKTSYFSQHYFAQIILLLLNGTAGIWFAITLFSSESLSGGFRTLLEVVIILFTILALLLAFVKLVLRSGDNARSLHSLSRSQAKFTTQIKRFKLITEDGIRIQALHLIGKGPREKVIIVCHGGGRNKDIEANVATCELLFEDYDVLTFDFRGHQESGGSWRGDETSKYDLKCVIDYAREHGYRKIGIVGWSFGAWIAVIEVSEYHNADTLVAAAPPPTEMRDTKMTRSLFSWAYRPWAFPVRALITVFRGVRISKYDSHPSLLDYVNRVSPIPLLIVCNEYDQTIGMPVDRFRELFDKAKEPKEFHVLSGTGHIYDWPNTFHYLTFVREWLARTLI